MYRSTLLVSTTLLVATFVRDTVDGFGFSVPTNTRSSCHRPPSLLSSLFDENPTTTTTLSSTIIAKPTTTSSRRLYARPVSKWDLIEDDDDDENNDDDGKGEYTPTAPDMTYVPRHVKRQHETFVDIRTVGGKEMTNDVYVRVPSEDVFWYVGKVARVSDVSLQDTIQRQWGMIEHHACNLRPIELFPYRGTLELWTAPGDSELEVAYNRPSLQMVPIPKPDDILTNKEVRIGTIGFQGEVYQNGEHGFRTWRNNDGRPARPEINPGGETRPPTDEEYAQIQKELAGHDMNKLYEEQERRKKEGQL